MTTNDDGMHGFYVWITTSIGDYAEALVGKLIRRGYSVMALGGRLVLSRDDNPSTVIAFTLTRRLTKDDKHDEIKCSEIYAEVVDVIKLLEGKFWSIVITRNHEGCTWDVSNISISQEKQEFLDEAKKMN